jgi:hypothetical protein
VCSASSCLLFSCSTDWWEARVAASCLRPLRRTGCRSRRSNRCAEEQAHSWEASSWTRSTSPGLPLSHAASFSLTAGGSCSRPGQGLTKPLTSPRHRGRVPTALGRFPSQGHS